MHSVFGNNNNSAVAFGAGVVAEQFAFTGTGSIIGLNFYATPSWENAYVALRTSTELEQRAIASGQWGYAGIANFLSALCVMNLADLFGDVPFNEAFDPTQNIQPAFDNDEDLYKRVEVLLDSAISRFDRATSAVTRPSKDDLVFNGNMTLWKKSAWALKARLFMRLSNTDKQGFATKALAAVQNSFGAGEAMNLTFFTDDNFNGNPVSIGYILQSAVGVSENLVNTMKYFLNPGEEVNGDPRSRIWFTLIGGKVVPAPCGKAVTDISINGTTYSKPAFMRERRAPLPVLTFVELKFIAAEAHLLLGNNEKANEEYELAVRSALSQASLFSPTAVLSQTEINDYLSRSKVFPGASSLTVKDIVLQKYIFYFQFQHVEAYNEFRRTGLLAVTDPLGHAFRFPYPQNEVSRNANAPQGINDQTIYSSVNRLFWAEL
ncbi:SusD/RagB family nutrient-binding outer membrane lipoprotein [Flavihumibacter sp. RY-1]|uniref:SusD/RagB family nutrient-binding outer membrane lipoprotein n=2 Tax=Flavihumibacter fluminis TaxID=2909236 RepID=A0ABS9BDC0_9BACT|nr:SusD/RagB family nutrient-binding outer membrane lipoprotein [Flavihumibacter fluminis]